MAKSFNDLLTHSQKRHLSEMINPVTSETLYCRPWGSAELRCAQALVKKGFLTGSYVTSTDGYYLTEKGLEVAREIRNANEK